MRVRGGSVMIDGAPFFWYRWFVLSDRSSRWKTVTVEAVLLMSPAALLS